MATFRKGSKVEVISHEDGFWGSYWEGKIVANVGEDYVVEYKHLLVSDYTRPLREVVTAEKLRPRPKELPVKRFRFGDCVDAFDNDGWWIGKIAGVKIDEGMMQYYVNFEFFNNIELPYDWKNIRIHQEWTNGEWCLQETNRGSYEFGSVLD